MTDGGGIAPLLKTLLHYYCAAFFMRRDLSKEGVRLCDDPVLQSQWDDPAEKPPGTERQGPTHKWNKPALQLANGGIAHMTPDSIAFNMCIPEKAFMRFNLSNDGSPATIIALFLARTIDALHPNAALRRSSKAWRRWTACRRAKHVAFAGWRRCRGASLLL